MEKSKKLGFLDVFKPICAIASKELGRADDYIRGTVDKSLLDCYDYLDCHRLLGAIEKQFNIVFGPYSLDVVETLLDVAFYVCHYESFQQGEQTPSAQVDKMIVIRNKMRPVLNSIWPEEVVDEFYIYSPDSLYHMKRKLGLDPSLYWDLVPSNFALCFDDRCPLRKKCIRWQAGELLPDEIYTAVCVMPCSRIGENCRMYVCKDDAVSYEAFFKWCKSL